MKSNRPASGNDKKRLKKPNHPIKCTTGKAAFHVVRLSLTLAIHLSRFDWDRVYRPTKRNATIFSNRECIFSIKLPSVASRNAGSLAAPQGWSDWVFIFAVGGASNSLLCE